MPSTVRHHFLIVVVPVAALRAWAEIVKTPDTVVFERVDHSTEGPVLEKFVTKLVLAAVRFEVSVTVTWYVRDPLAMSVESQVNWAVVRS